jgi:hypothetical protein
MAETRICNRCAADLPLDEDHFRLTPEGFRGTCRNCQRKDAKEKKKREKAQRAASLRRVEADGVDFWLSQVKAGGSNIPHSAEVIERVIEYFGGTGGFSAMLVKQYYDSKPGSSARNRLLETICRLISKNVDQGGVKKPISLWSEDELEQELQARFRAAVQIVQGVVDGPKETPAALPAEVAGSGGATDAIRAAGDQKPPERTPRKKSRSAKTLQAKPKPRSDPRLQGE